MFEIDRYHDFSAGHRVYGHESKCAHLHGHNYRVHFVVAPEFDPRYAVLASGEVQPVDLDNIGRVIDFSVVKSTLCEWLEENWDHKMLVYWDDPLAAQLKALDPDGVVVVPFNPTAENMARHLVEVVGPEQLRGTGVRLVRCRIEETRKCAATYSLG